MSQALETIISYLEAIPAEKWIKEHYSGAVGSHCAMGHLGWGGAPRTLGIIDTAFTTLRLELGYSYDLALHDRITEANDSSGCPKENTLNYLKSLRE